jgi:uncharacterized YigZ family protein
MSIGYFTLQGECENTIIIERSKFICSMKCVDNEDDAKSFIETIRKKHSLANHNCYAYIADDKGLIQKFSDDGEPQGTAGLPMLEVLKNKKLYKTVAVVTRYFGGIKLGTGGLTRAYSGSVTDCLKTAKVVNMLASKTFTTTIEYDGYSKLLKVLSSEDIKILNTEFENLVSVSFAVKEDKVDIVLENINNAFNGKQKIFEKDSGYSAF